MRVLKLTLAYDGTDFAGWQRQADARTVQATLEAALEPVAGMPVKVVGAGRTDAGVHAAAQVASVTIASPLGLDELQNALNATLPPDVRVLDIEPANDGFDARRDARWKTYRYAVWIGRVMPPLLRRTAWHVTHRLDVAAMNAASTALVGTHDFAAFQSAGSNARSTTREVIDASWTARGWSGDTIGEVLTTAEGASLLSFDVTGNGFLRHMVRTMVGTLVEVGRGRLAPSDLARILGSRRRSEAGPTAPAHGLTLQSILYTDAPSNLDNCSVR
jgi:tRNA pseudouridine38-40 synthase